MACYTVFRPSAECDEVHIDLTEHFDASRYEDLIFMFHTDFADRLVERLRANKVASVGIHIDNTHSIPAAWTGVLIHTLIDAGFGVWVSNE